MLLNPVNTAVVMLGVWRWSAVPFYSCSFAVAIHSSFVLAHLANGTHEKTMHRSAPCLTMPARCLRVFCCSPSRTILIIRFRQCLFSFVHCLWCTHAIMAASHHEGKFDSCIASSHNDSRTLACLLCMRSFILLRFLVLIWVFPFTTSPNVLATAPPSSMYHLSSKPIPWSEFLTYPCVYSSIDFSRVSALSCICMSPPFRPSMFPC
jgi:hypothetical protein